VIGDWLCTLTGVTVLLIQHNVMNETLPCLAKQLLERVGILAITNVDQETIQVCLVADVAPTEPECC
jgi:hypothetical protein